MINDELWSLERASPVPLYYQLACRIRGKIQGGGWAPGMRLPTEHELARQACISRLTARQCYTLLEKDGLVSRFRSKGTYVAQHGRQAPLSACKNTLFMTFVKELDVFFAQILQGIEKGLNEGGCNLVVRLAAENEGGAVRDVIQARPDGFIWLFWDFDQAPALIRKIQSAGLPLVIIDSRVDHMRADFAGIDLAWGMAQLARQLAEQGCRRIRFLNVGHRHYRLIMHEQEEAFSKAVAASGLAQTACRVMHVERPMADGLKVEPLLDDVARCQAQYDALILNTVFDDPLNYARYLWTHHGAVLQGQKVGFMLSDAHPATSVAGLPLVSVLRPDFDMGRSAAELMMKRLRGQGPRCPKTILLRS